MTVPLLTVLLFLAQPTPAAPPPAAAAKPPEPPSARLEAVLAELKGKPQATFTSRLGPAASTRAATDGQVLIWSVNLPGETVCGANAAGALACQRQGGGDCVIAIAFKTDGAMSIWRASGHPAACNKVADQLKPAG